MEGTVKPRNIDGQIVCPPGYELRPDGACYPVGSAVPAPESTIVTEPPVMLPLVTEDTILRGAEQGGVDEADEPPPAPTHVEPGDAADEPDEPDEPDDEDADAEDAEDDDADDGE